MQNNLLKRLIPHIVAYFILMAAAFIFFLPYFTEGKSLNPPDTLRAHGMQGEMKKVQKETGTYPLWTNSMFGGMPTYQILHPGSGNMTKYIYKYALLAQGITKPPFVCLMAMFCCYLMFWVMKVDWRIAIFCSFAFGMGTYFMDLAEAGHAAKMATLGLVPGMIAGVLMVFRKKYLLGGTTFALMTSMNIYANHYQITFYAFLILAIFGIFQIVKAARTKEWGHFAKSTGILTFALGIAILCNLSRMWTTYEYSKETIRGKSELSSKASKGDGLDKNYIWGWSYGKLESMTMLVPNFNGGGTSQTFKGTKFYDRYYPAVKSQMSQQNARMPAQELRKKAEQQVAMLFYWGNQPMVGTAIYFGAIICFLFLLGAFIVPGEMKWWLLVSTFFSLSLAWGGNFFLNEIFVDYFPLFNKFRAVSMALGLTILTAVALAGLGLQKFFDNDLSAETKKKALLISLGITGGLCLLAVVLSGTMQMIGKNDAQMGQELASLIQEGRGNIMRADAFRSLALIFLAAGILFAGLKGKLKSVVAVVLIGLLSTIDIWVVNKRTVFTDKYEMPKVNEVEPQQVDKQLMAEKDPHFRVLDLRADPFTNYRTSYFHKSLGGYHAAKLMRYQDLVERYLTKPSENRHIVGMLNGKYFIQGQGAEGRAMLNDKALGNAWFVKEYQIVANGDEEMNGLANLNPANKALIQKDFASSLNGFQIQYDSTANIKLETYHPDKMVYKYSAKTDQLAVFSEVYYPSDKGWKVFLDGAEIGPIMKANFLLRALKLPAGTNKTLEMRFEPKSFYTGEMISMICSLLLLVGFFGALFLAFKNGIIPESNHLKNEILVTSPTKSTLVKQDKKPTVTKSNEEKKGKKRKKK